MAYVSLKMTETFPLPEWLLQAPIASLTAALGSQGLSFTGVSGGRSSTVLQDNILSPAVTQSNFGLQMSDPSLRDFSCRGPWEN